MKRGSTGRYEVTTVSVEARIARELTGKKRNRVFVYDRYLALLGEGTEPA